MYILGNNEELECYTLLHLKKKSVQYRDELMLPNKSLISSPIIREEVGSPEKLII